MLAVLAAVYSLTWLVSSSTADTALASPSDASSSMRTVML